MDKIEFNKNGAFLHSKEYHENAKIVALLMLKLPYDRLRNEIYALLLASNFDLKSMMYELEKELKDDKRTIIN